MDEAVRPKDQLGVGSLSISDLEKQYVNEVLDSNRLSYGPFSQLFEQQFAGAHHVRRAVLCNSGTSALHVALLALKEKYRWQDGDEVLVPAMTFVATSNAVLMAGLTPVFVDIDRRAYTLDPELVEARITPRTRAIIPVHMFGLPAHMAPIMALAQRHGLRVVEDSCEAMFVSVDGKPVGSHGDIGCFSTYVAHFLVTGVGGLAVTNDDDLAVIMRSLCNHGRDGIYLSIDDDQGKSSEELSLIVGKRFQFVRLGHSYRITEMEAALGLAQMERKDEILAARRRNAAALVEGLRPLERRGLLQLPSEPHYAQHAFMIFPIVITDPGVSRQELTLALEERLIETRPMMPLINQPLYLERFGDIEEEYPVARWTNSNGFYIGCHQGFGEAELGYIVETFRELLR